MRSLACTTHRAHSVGVARGHRAPGAGADAVAGTGGVGGAGGLQAQQAAHLLDAEGHLLPRLGCQLWTCLDGDCF